MSVWGCDTKHPVGGGGGGGGVDGIPFIKKIEEREAAQDHQDLLAAAWLVK